MRFFELGWVRESRAFLLNGSVALLDIIVFIILPFGFFFRRFIAFFEKCEVVLILVLTWFALERLLWRLHRGLVYLALIDACKSTYYLATLAEDLSAVVLLR